MDLSILGLDTAEQYGQKDGNLLIRGENLAVMRALAPVMDGLIKMIYIDPPFNTGGRFDHYRDDLDSGSWLLMMEERLPLLRSLLRPDGAIFVHLDDSELAYCKMAMDRIFGRGNYITTIVMQSATPSSFKTVNPGPADVVEYILMYCRKREAFHYEQQFVPRDGVDMTRFGRYVINPGDHPSAWKFGSIVKKVMEEMGLPGQAGNVRGSIAGRELREIVARRAEEFALANAGRVFETKTVQRPGRRLAEAIARSRLEPGVIRVEREQRPDLFLYRGRQLYFLAGNIREWEGHKAVVQPLSNLWTDIPTSNLHREGGVDFRYGKKPERLLRRLIEMSTLPGEWVLDVFAGSGTTGAVAHKLKRRWIMVEAGPQAESHALPRMRRVVNGEDRTGISGETEWRGGGGFTFARLIDGAALEVSAAGGRPPATVEAIVVAAVFRRGDRYLVAQRADNLLWEFPGGKVAAGEDIRDALCREIKEEIGVEAEAGEPLEVAMVNEPRRLLIIFLAARFVQGQPEPLEHKALCWVSPGEMGELDLAPADREMAAILAGRERRSAPLKP